MAYETAIEAINTTVVAVLKENDKPDTLENRIHVLRRLLSEMDREHQVKDDAELFRLRSLINSEISVLRVRQHIHQLDLF